MNRLIEFYKRYHGGTETIPNVDTLEFEAILEKWAQEMKEHME